MRKLYILLYSLILSYSSLFAYTTGTYQPNSWSYSTVEACEEATLTTSDNYFIYMSLHSPYCDNTTLMMVYTCDEGHYSNTEFQYVDYGPRGCEYVSPVCTSPQILNDYGDTCIDAVLPCEPISNFSLPIEQASCSGVVNDYDIGLSGVLVWQDCDNTCYISEAVAIPCEELESTSLSKCNLLHNNFYFSCSIVDGLANVSTNECIIKTNPCDDEYNKVALTCDLTTQKVDGYSECTHNGLYITNESIKCVDDVPDILSATDCSSLWHEVLNSGTNSCDCADGYSRNTWGDCWKPLFDLDSNETTVEQLATEQLEQENNHKDKVQSEADSNATTLSQLADNNTNDTLSGIRQDLNATNALLSKLNDNNSSSNLSSINKAIDDILNGVGMELDGNGDPKPADSLNTSKITDFMNNIKDDVQGVINSFDSTKALIENPFTIDVQSKSCTPLEITMWGRNVQLDIFTYISIIRPVLTFILTVAMYILSIKIFMKGLGLKND